MADQPAPFVLAPLLDEACHKAVGAGRRDIGAALVLGHR